MIHRTESAFTHVNKQTLDTNLVRKDDCAPIKTLYLKYSNTTRIIKAGTIY